MRFGGPAVNTTWVAPTRRRMRRQPSRTRTSSSTVVEQFRSGLASEKAKSTAAEPREPESSRRRFRRCSSNRYARMQPQSQSAVVVFTSLTPPTITNVRFPLASASDMRVTDSTIGRFESCLLFMPLSAPASKVCRQLSRAAAAARFAARPLPPDPAEMVTVARLVAPVASSANIQTRRIDPGAPAAQSSAPSTTAVIAWGVEADRSVFEQRMSIVVGGSNVVGGSQRPAARQREAADASEHPVTSKARAKEEKCRRDRVVIYKRVQDQPRSVTGPRKTDGSPSETRVRRDATPRP